MSEELVLPPREYIYQIMMARSAEIIREMESRQKEDNLT